MAELTADQVQALIRLEVPMAEDIDLRIDRLDADLAVARVPFHGKLVRPGGTLSGPTIMVAGRCSHVRSGARAVGAGGDGGDGQSRISTSWPGRSPWT